MQGSLPGEIVFVSAVLAVVSPVLVLLHELGHASVGYLRTEGVVHVRVGRQPGWLRGRVGRVSFELSPFPEQVDERGTASVFARLGPYERLVFVLAGPAVSLACAALFTTAAVAATGHVREALLVAGAAALAQGVINLVPHQVRERKSDGLCALEQLRRMGQPPRSALDGSSSEPYLREFEATWARWWALYSNPKASERTQARAKAIGGIAWHLDRERPAQQLFPFVYAGWCWRHVEPAAEHVPLAIRMSLKRAVDAGARQPILLIAASVDAVTGLANANELERPDGRGFHARACRSLAAPEDDLPVPESLRHRAFLAGVALHDVETIAPTL